MSDERAGDLMTFDLADHCAAFTKRRTAPGLVVKQAIAPKNNGTDPKLQSIWGVWDERREEWLACYVDPDNVPL